MSELTIKNYDGQDTHLTPQHYQMVMQSQSACNLSGIVKWLGKTMDAIWEEARARKQGTDWVNEHPICRLMAEQIAHLSGAGTCSSTNYGDADRYFRERSM